MPILTRPVIIQDDFVYTHNSAITSKVIDIVHAYKPKTDTHSAIVILHREEDGEWETLACINGQSIWLSATESFIFHVLVNVPKNRAFLLFKTLVQWKAEHMSDNSDAIHLTSNILKHRASGDAFFYHDRFMLMFYQDKIIAFEPEPTQWGDYEWTIRFVTLQDTIDGIRVQDAKTQCDQA